MRNKWALGDSSQSRIRQVINFPHRTLSLKIPNVEFDVGYSMLGFTTLHMHRKYKNEAITKSNNICLNKTKIKKHICCIRLTTSNIAKITHYP